MDEAVISLFSEGAYGKDVFGTSDRFNVHDKVTNPIPAWRNMLKNFVEGTSNSRDTL